MKLKLPNIALHALILRYSIYVDTKSNEFAKHKKRGGEIRRKTKKVYLFASGMTSKS